MDLLEQSKKTVKVHLKELESKIRSKKDLYHILHQCCMLIIYNFFRPVLFTKSTTM
jgi:hypothetical protein